MSKLKLTKAMIASMKTDYQVRSERIRQGLKAKKEREKNVK